jgi:hypothetical protein
VASTRGQLLLFNMATGSLLVACRAAHVAGTTISQVQSCVSIKAGLLLCVVGLILSCLTSSAVLLSFTMTHLSGVVTQSP